MCNLVHAPVALDADEAQTPEARGQEGERCRKMQRSNAMWKPS